MKSLSIREPSIAFGVDSFAARALSEDPREGIPLVQYDVGNGGADIVFNSVQYASSVFIGYIANLPAIAKIDIYGVSPSSGYIYLGQAIRADARRGSLSHGFIDFARVQIKGVAFRFFVNDGPLDLSKTTVGVVSFSDNIFRSEWGYEWGAGRPLDDTSAVERLPSGSFAIDRGVVTSGYQWTFGDLSHDERERLYDIHRAVGRSRSVLVIEDDDRTPGLYERMHWGLLAKLDTYARVDPTATTWGMQVADWL